MNKLYGSIIIFFYFIKYPVIIFLPILYLGFNYPPNIILDSIWIVSAILILKDKLYGKPKECRMKKTKNIISSVVSLQIGKIKIIKDSSIKDGQWSTGSYKEPVSNIRDVTFNGINGDEVSDLIHHGGEHKAIFANSVENYKQWAKYLEKDSLKYGALAENLTLSSIKEEDVCIGDIHKIGTTILEVSQPREPCWKISKKHNNKTFTKHIYNSGRTGWYYRVLEEGQIKQNNDVELIRRIKNPITILKANEILREPLENKELLNHLINLDILGEPFRKSLLKKSLIKKV
jgi:MOSC domain-containing protein YiiM